MKKNPKANMQLRSKKVFEACLIVAIILHIAVFSAFKKFETEEYVFDETETILEIENIPETEQIKKPPPPAAPSVPVESEDEELLDDITIEETEFESFMFDDAPPPPPRIEEEEIPPFLPYEDQPKVIGGLAAIQRLVKYPEIARKAGIEGQVLILVLVSTDGIPTEFQVVKSLGNNGCDEAAIDAIKQVRFIPAKQRDRPVPFRISIPIRFQIKSGG